MINELRAHMTAMAFHGLMLEHKLRCNKHAQLERPGIVGISAIEEVFRCAWCDSKEPWLFGWPVTVVNQEQMHEWICRVLIQGGAAEFNKRAHSMSDDLNNLKVLHDFLTAPDGYAALEAVLRPMVLKALIKHRDAFIGPPELVYKGAGDFLLQHGKFFTCVADIPMAHRAPRGYCYGSAIAAACKYGEKYFEGVALAPQVESSRVRESEQGTLAMHAWNIHPDRPNLVIDRTWWDAPGMIYCGVEFSVERADDCTWNGDACVLHDEHRGFPLFRQRWDGEPAGLVWPASERLEIMRNNDRVAGMALIDRMKKQGVWDPDDKTGIRKKV